MLKLSKKISNSKWFQNFVTTAILIAGVLVGLATYEKFSVRHENILELLNQIILGIFILEIIIKVLAEGNKPWLYFTDGWNIFDFIIVTAAFLPFGGSSIAILRLLRLLRVLKLIKALPKLQMLVRALLKSLPSMGYVSILLTLLFYIYAVAGVFFFGKNDPIHFGDLQTSMLSLFRIVTLEDWTDIMYINMYGCENYGYTDTMNLCTNSTASSALSITFFVTFVLIGTMIFLNLFIGVVMNGMDEAKNEMLLEERMEEEGNDIKIEDVENKISELEEVLSLYKVQQKLSNN
ncbi:MULTISPECIES: ion transporter [Tenacibaculum]|mgnify:CR=1 FL=1|uniref:ion transporter n=1 Tax=Tenacibaculum TaxID=104267 RepID=UPI0021AF9689|nr:MULTISPECIES: ion transporter [Tenacibaculum]MCT4698455.1 ion transporter [Tenacibaculum haliotis]WBX71244.1 ion transporter [Tenacibaculum retecalamus]